MLKRKQVVVTKTFKFGKNSEDVVKTNAIKETVTDGTVVKAAYGVTISKNYNSCRVDVGVEYPTVKGKIYQAFEEAWDICGNQMSEQLKEAREFLKKLG